MNRLRRSLLTIAVVMMGAAGAAAAPAEVEVSGLGWLDNLRMERSLVRLRANPEAEVLYANGVEDAVFFLYSALAEDGYLRPQITAELHPVEGAPFTHTFDPELTQLLPRPLVLRRAHFQVRPGVRSEFREIRFTGDLAGFQPDALERLVLPRGTALSVTPDRSFSPRALQRGLGQVTDALMHAGYADVRVEATEVAHYPESGKVDVTINVTPGPLWRVTRVEWQAPDVPGVERPSLEPRLGQPWNAAWEQDALALVRHAYFRAGYPDVRLRAEHLPAPAANGRRDIGVLLVVEAGPRVTAGPVRFEGNHGVKESVLRRRVRTEPGEPLNPLAFEAARYRLARLGAFRRVQLEFEPADGAERSPVFTLTPLSDWEVHLLAGYGSYEQLRAGVEVRRNNLFGRAHQARLELVQSFKASEGELTYSVPELFGEAVDGSLQLFGLRREELAFLRQEFGGTLSLRRRRLPWVDAEGTLSYTYQSLQNRENELVTRAEDLRDTIAASIEFGLSRDRRDNPLQPRRGYRWYTQTEVASEALGGEVDYQRVELGLVWHWPWGDTRWLHAGISHGVVLTLGAPNDRELPVNRRFYPGGDNSVRGYQLGEAAPRAPDGRFIGAKSTGLLNLEFEQAIYGRFTGVLFVDALGQASELAEYPFDEYLVSAGLGLRYQTIIGPVRLEYGHNLNRREGDPSGTLHFSLGFPF